MNEPKVGEYWCCGPDEDKIVHIDRAVGIGYYNEDYYVSTLFEYNRRCSRSWLKRKWRPNLFWKLLGYK